MDVADVIGLVELCNSRRGLRVGWRRWRNGLTVTSVIWWPHTAFKGLAGC